MRGAYLMRILQKWEFEDLMKEFPDGALFLRNMNQMF